MKAINFALLFGSRKKCKVWRWTGWMMCKNEVTFLLVKVRFTVSSQVIPPS